MLRHEVRTLLNHIAGYGDILRLDAIEYRIQDLELVFSAIQAKATDIRALVGRYLSEDSGDKAIAELKTAMALPVQEIVALIVKARNLSETHDTQAFLLDIEKMLDSAGKLLELLDRGVNELSFPPEENACSTALAPDGECIEIPTSRDLGADSAADGDSTILIVDDNGYNRDMLERFVRRMGYPTITAEDGAQALAIMGERKVDLVLLDYVMPNMNGYQVLEAMRARETLKSIPVIMVSMVDTRESIAKCIQMGAEDYLPKEFDPMLLRARVEACLSRAKANRAKEAYIRSVIDNQRRIAQDLKDAAGYIEGLLPPPFESEELDASWVFIPSLSLGGDVFGYQWVDDSRLAIYLIDVSGHGAEAALLSVSILNMLKNRAVNAERDHPAETLRALNQTFKIEEQNNMFFAIWYGVWDRETRVLTYSSGGSSPAVIFAPDSSARELSTGDIIIGVDQEADFGTSQLSVPKGSHLYLFSDGIYEVRKANGQILGLSDFITILRGQRSASLDSLVSTIRGLSAKDTFEDDVSLIRFHFK
jgi:phosphoserine phosphatase RsbU/P